MNVQLLTQSDQATHADTFEAMYRQRHDVFAMNSVGQLRSETGREVDQFDDDHAEYLIAYDGPTVLGSLRLLPAWRRSMLLECWPEHLHVDERRMEEGVWEWTRWCPGSIDRPRALVAARRALILAAVEFGQRRRARRFVTLCETKFLRQLDGLGWEPKALGPSFDYPEGTAIGVGWTLRPNALVETDARLRPTRIAEHPSSLDAIARAA